MLLSATYTTMLAHYNRVNVYDPRYKKKFTAVRIVIVLYAGAITAASIGMGGNCGKCRGDS